MPWQLVFTTVCNLVLSPVLIPMFCQSEIDSYPGFSDGNFSVLPMLFCHKLTRSTHVILSEIYPFYPCFSVKHLPILPSFSCHKHPFYSCYSVANLSCSMSLTYQFYYEFTRFLCIFLCAKLTLLSCLQVLCEDLHRSP